MGANTAYQKIANRKHGGVVGDPKMANELAGRNRPRGSTGDLIDTTHGPTVLPERI